ncbi:MAG TPA: energy transducer TonB [Blastocatellia bacterium]|nr:energy transducer TonB [Blastocatellia bacterium]
MTTELAGVRAQKEILPDFSLLQEKGLGTRLWEELCRAATDFSSDPIGFVHGLFASNSKDAKRRRRLYLGLALAMIAHITLATVVVIASKNRITVEPLRDGSGEVVTLLGPGSKPRDGDIPPAPKSGHSLSGNPTAGGGAGNPLPPSKGVPPRLVPLPPLVRISPATIDNPSLAITPSIPGELSVPVPPDVVLGDPSGQPGPFSAGPGKNGVAGTGTGLSIGPGAGSGREGNGGTRDGVSKAGGPNGSGGADVLDYVRDRLRPGFAKFDWTYRAHPIVTAEAQKNQVVGTVLLRATFNADGTITDIEVIQPVEFMTESAIESLKRCKFRPTTLFGKAVTLRNVPVKIEVHY